MNVAADITRILTSIALAALLVPVAPASASPDDAAAADTDAAAATDTATETAVSTATDTATETAETAYREDSIIVVLDDEGASKRKQAAVADEAEESLADEGIDIEEELADATDDTGTVVEASVPEDLTVAEAVEAAESADGVAHAQPNYVYKLLEDDDSSYATDDDSSYATASVDDPAAATSDTSTTANQYYLYGDESDTTGTKGADVIDAWDTATTDGAVTIVVMDTGVNLKHKDLKANILTDYCWDFYNNEQLVATSSFNGDYYGHGTHVCGIAAAEANNATGIAGTSYNANIIAYKIFDDSSSDPSASTSTLIAAFEELVDLTEEEPDLNIRVANLSLGAYETDSTSSHGGPGNWGGPSDDDEDDALEDAVNEAYDAGVLTVCAGGNGSGSKPYTDKMIPADYDNCMAVTALDTDGTNATWSDFNEYKDISAPGVSIYSTYNSSTTSYATESGTSMASPVVAGIAALLWAACPDATIEEVVSAIKGTADEIDDSDDTYKRNSTGYTTGMGMNRTTVVSGSAGAINAEAAVSYLVSYWAETYCSQGTHTGGTATCSAAAVCSVCGESYGEVDTANGHSFGSGVVTTTATPKRLGVRTYTCTICKGTVSGGTKTETFKYTQTLSVRRWTRTLSATTLQVKPRTVKPYSVKGVKTSAAYRRVRMRRNGRRVTASVRSKIVVNAKTGKVTCKKGLPKGTYRIRIRVTAASNTYCTAATKATTVVVKVK